MAKRNRGSTRTAPGHKTRQTTAPKPPAPATSTTTALLIALSLAILTIVVFAQIGSHDFVDLDDTGYVVENTHVTTGLNAANVEWAMTSGYAANWHPLTWMSHQLDASLFGTRPGPQHLVSLGWHVANVLLLFALLRFMTGATWRSAFVAAAFAVHPVHVESVAWLAERKDVLSTFFWLASTWMYVAWVRRPAPARYAAMLALFVLGLMAKPMLVTMPFTLLLLDVWPLGRTATPRSRRLTEKLPLFALALVSSIITAIVQQQGGAVGSLELVSGDHAPRERRRRLRPLRARAVLANGSRGVLSVRQTARHGSDRRELGGAGDDYGDRLATPARSACRPDWLALVRGHHCAGDWARADRHARLCRSLYLYSLTSAC
jgi:hypothetical protein